MRVNSILEAIKKTSIPPPPGGETPSSSKDFLFNKSPYDSASIYWERRKIHDDRGMRRTVAIALALGALSTIVTIALVVYILLGQKNASVAATPPNPPVVALAPAPSPTPLAPLPQMTVVEEELPAPADDSSLEGPLPLDLPGQDDLAAIDPLVTPLPLDISQTPSFEELELSRPSPIIEEPVDDGPAYRLQGIIWDAQNPMAMVNGRSVRPGDKVGDAKIMQINRSSVVLEVDGERITLK